MPENVLKFRTCLGKGALAPSTSALPVEEGGEVAGSEVETRASFVVRIEAKVITCPFSPLTLAS